ncbi:MAG: hypothetical protein ACFB21_08265 [Opitutales bacterium]
MTISTDRGGFRSRVTVAALVLLASLAAALVNGQTVRGLPLLAVADETPAKELPWYLELRPPVVEPDPPQRTQTEDEVDPEELERRKEELARELAQLTGSEDESGESEGTGEDPADFSSFLNRVSRLNQSEDPDLLDQPEEEGAEEEELDLPGFAR